MMELMKKYALWRILFTLLEYPRTQLHINDIARLSKTSTMTAKTYIDKLEENEIVETVKKGNMRLVKLRDNFATKELKKFYASLVGIEIKKHTNGETYFFGSFPDGNYDEKSDIDILTTGKCKISSVEGFPVNSMEVSRLKWIEMIKNKHPLVLEVKKGWRLDDES